ncbi:MAG: FAD-dependent thymidylate synthase [Methanobacteriota archaeon]|nr:MAG: FAD-dependent thymidylate synthase [Euryarchaeota archaeon]
MVEEERIESEFSPDPVEITLKSGENIRVEFQDIDVQLLDMMKLDNDRKPARVARISYGRLFTEEQGRTEEQDVALARYLLWHRHTSPFENIEFLFLVHVPLFVARQMHRHRTASINEVSRRYTTQGLSMFNFELRTKDTTVTKQGSGNVILYADPQFKEHYDKAYDLARESIELYFDLIDRGVAPETARQFLPQHMMTTFTFKMDLHNLFHFLDLRLDSHAQKEIRIVAQKMLNLISEKIPKLTQIFMDYRKMKDAFMEVGYEWFKQGMAEEFVLQLKEKMRVD